MALIKIPEYAKNNAEKGLRLRRKVSKAEKFGLTRSEAKEKGVSSLRNVPSRDVVVIMAELDETGGATVEVGYEPAWQQEW